MRLYSTTRFSCSLIIRFAQATTISASTFRNWTDYVLPVLSKEFLSSVDINHKGILFFQKKTERVRSRIGKILTRSMNAGGKENLTQNRDYCTCMFAFSWKNLHCIVSLNFCTWKIRGLNGIDNLRNNWQAIHCFVDTLKERFLWYLCWNKFSNIKKLILLRHRQNFFRSYLDRNQISKQTNLRLSRAQSKVR